jgi:hypothetical protein
MSCHTLDGYRGIKGLLQTRDSNGVASLLTMLKMRTPDAPYHAFMPPLAATPSEMNDLKIYLCAVTHKKILPPPPPPIAAPGAAGAAAAPAAQPKGKIAPSAAGPPPGGPGGLVKT